MRTTQLEAHRACQQVDALLEHVVLAYVPTRDMLANELAEHADARWGDPEYSPAEHRRRRVRGVLRLRAAVVALGDVLDELRADLGVDKQDLPGSDGGVRAELARLRAAERPADDSGVTT